MIVQSLDSNPVLEAYDRYRECLGSADRYREDIGISPKSHHDVDVVQSRSKLLSSLESALSPFRRDDINNDVITSLGNPPYCRADVYTLASQGESRVLVARTLHRGWNGNTPMKGTDHRDFSCLVAPEKVPISDLLKLSMITNGGSRPCPHSMSGAYVHVGVASVAVLENIAFGVVSALNIVQGVNNSLLGVNDTSSFLVGFCGLSASVVFGKVFINQFLSVGALPEYRLALANSLSERVEGFDGALRFLGVKDSGNEND